MAFRSRRPAALNKSTKSGNAHEGAVFTARFSNDGKYFVTAGYDELLNIWNSSDGSLSSQSDYHGNVIRDVCFSRDDLMLCSCDDDGVVFYYDLHTGRRVRHVHQFEGHKDGVNAVTFDDFGSVIVSADSCLRLWDCRYDSIKPIQIFDTFKDSVTSVCLSGPAEIIAGCLDGSVQKFDLRNNTRLSHDLGSPVTSISMGNTGTCLVASRLGSTFQLMRVRTKTLRAGGTYSGHTSKSSKLGCCFNKDTTRVVGGSEDGRIFFWGLVSKQVVSEFDGHSAAVTSIDYHPTEDWMVSASMDGSVVLWKDSM